MKTLFDHLKQITKNKNKKYWNLLTDDDKKSWNSYIINRFLSMDYNYIEIVDILSKFIYLENKLYYILLAEFIPRSNVFLKYIKPKIKNNSELLNYISKYYDCSKKESIQYLELLTKNDLYLILKNFGLKNEEIKKIIGK